PTTRLVEKAQTNAPVLTIVPPEYEAYVNQRMAFFNSEFPVELATPEDVADAILASVNDETGQLRWVVGADQAERMHMRHETTEAEYNDWTWRQFGPSARKRELISSCRWQVRHDLIAWRAFASDEEAPG